jgi:Flp pilus assembly protein CpaB
VEALLLLMAEDNGSIRLTVRAPGDSTVFSISPGELVAQLQSRAGTTPGDVTTVTLGAVEALLPLNDQTSVSYVVPEGQRALAIAVSKVVGAGGLIRPGDHVDIVVVLQVEVIGDGDSVTFSRAFTLTQNVEVLAVEQALEALGEGVATGDGARGTTAGDTEAQPPAQPDAQVVTLALTPQVAQQVMLAELEGEIRLSVRAPGDTEFIEINDTAFFSIANSTNPFDLISSSVQILGEDQ